MAEPEIVDALPSESRAKVRTYIALTSLFFGVVGGTIGGAIVWKVLSAKITNLENAVAYHETIVQNLRNIHWASKDPDNYIAIKPGDRQPCRPGSVVAGAAMAAQGQELDLYCVELVPRR